MPAKICLFNGLREAVAARVPIALGANCRNVGAFAGRRVPDEEVDGRDIRLPSVTTRAQEPEKLDDLATCQTRFGRSGATRLTILKWIRTLKSAGVLADRGAADITPEFRRFNLIYGFNGSGKSTLSRILASLEIGKISPELPEGCEFEIELSDGNILKSPSQLAGLEDRLRVFNTEFIGRNLRWADGKAASIFYISEEQADAATALKKAEADLPGLATAHSAAKQSVKDRAEALATFKRATAKLVAAKLHLSNRKYEAPALQTDFNTLSFDESSILDEKKLNEHESVTARSAPPPAAGKLEAPIDGLAKVISEAHEAAAAHVGDKMLAELVSHPAMVAWAKAGHEYHLEKKLSSCLLCGGALSTARKAALSEAFNDALNNFLSQLRQSRANAADLKKRLMTARENALQLQVLPEYRVALQSANDLVTAT